MARPMNVQPHTLESNSSAIPSRLAILALASVLFPRVLAAAGVPSVVNFAHFPLVAVCALVILPGCRDRMALELFAALACFAACIAASAITNGAGFINTFLDVLILTEPFLLLVLMVYVPWPPAAITQFRWTLWIFIAIHIVAAHYQRWVLGCEVDDVKGLFLNSGGGHHVGAAITLSAAVYYSIEWPGRPLWQRAVFAAAAGAAVVFADGKQALAVFLASLCILALFRGPNLRLAAQYLLAAGLVILLLMIAAYTVFPALRTWAEVDVVVVGITHKTTVFSMITERYESVWNWLFGLGPGHTIGRLGWLMPEYVEHLKPLGATMSPLTEAILNVNETHWISRASTGSSMWALLFSWAGIFGDLGLVGVAAYALLWVWVLAKTCCNDLGRFFALNAILLGCVYAWLEEPAYMLVNIALIALAFQEHHRRPAQQTDVIPPCARVKRNGMTRVPPFTPCIQGGHDYAGSQHPQPLPDPWR